MLMATVLANEVFFRRGGSFYRRPPAELAARARAGMPDALAYHRAQLAPAHPAEIVIMLTRLSVHFWQPDRPVEHVQSLIEDYVQDLAHLPSDVLQTAVATWRRTGQWWPKVSELLALAEPMLKERREDLRTCRQIAAALDAPIPEPIAPRTDTERDRATELVRKATASMQAARPLPRRSTAGRPRTSAPPTAEDPAEYRRAYENRMAEMEAEGLLQELEEDLSGKGGGVG